MLRAVNMGWLQSPRSVLSRRRAMRRLQLASFLATVGFTRNPSRLRGLGSVATLQTPQNAEGFRVFHEIRPPGLAGFALIRASPAALRLLVEPSRLAAECELDGPDRADVTSTDIY